MLRLTSALTSGYISLCVGKKVVKPDRGHLYHRVISVLHKITNPRYAMLPFMVVQPLCLETALRALFHHKIRRYLKVRRVFIVMNAKGKELGYMAKRTMVDRCMDSTFARQTIIAIISTEI